MNFRTATLSLAFVFLSPIGLSHNPAFAMPANGGHIYTSIGDGAQNRTSLCKVYSSVGEAENPVSESRCPRGPSGWPVTMLSADARDVVRFGKEVAGVSTAEALQGAFSDPNNIIEWRISGAVPHAAIHRYFIGSSQVLTVHKLNPDHTSCIAAMVAVEKGRDANVEAARFADDIVPSFRCGVDKLFSVGAVDALLQPK